MNKIAHLSTLAAKATTAKIEAYRFFPEFADALVVEMASFLGSDDCVALCCATGEFSFEEGNYGYDGLRIERGTFRVPLMFRLPSVIPGNDLLVRLRLYLIRVDSERFECQIEDAGSFTFALTDIQVIVSRVYEYLCFACSSTAWFELHPQHHCLARSCASGRLAQSKA
jgi:hypothetical protein